MSGPICTFCQASGPLPLAQQPTPIPPSFIDPPWKWPNGGWRGGCPGWNWASWGNIGGKFSTFILQIVLWIFFCFIGVGKNVLVSVSFPIFWFFLKKEVPRCQRLLRNWHFRAPPDPPPLLWRALAFWFDVYWSTALHGSWLLCFPRSSNFGWQGFGTNKFICVCPGEYGVSQVYKKIIHLAR